jgi:AcrR family transcriptional regulator
MPKTTTRGSRGDQARAALIRAGAELFAERGLDGASTREIAARAGQNVASIAYHFGGKDGLYLAVAQEIARQWSAALGPVVTEIEGFLQGSGRERRRAVELVRGFTETAVRGLLLRPEMVTLTQFVLREQLHPTSAFDLFYDGALARIHRALTGLVATALGLDAESNEAVVRAHAVLGQVLGFRVAGEAIRRRAGWKRIGPREAELIARVVGEHAEAILTSQYRKGPTP